MTPNRRNRTASRTILLSLAYTLSTLHLSGSAQTEPQVSLNLSQAIDLALQKNRTLRLAGLAVNDSEHKKEIARSAYFPQISNDSKVMHVTELAGVRVPAGAFGVPAATGAIPGQTLFIDQGAMTSYTSGTQLAQPLTQMFKIRESNRAAKADVDTAKVELSSAEDEIVLKVRKLYCDLLVAQLKLQSANEQTSASEVKNQEDIDAVAKGRALDDATLESQAAVLESRQTALTEKLAIHNLTLSLDDLLGLPLNSKLQLDADASATLVALPSRDECLHIAHDYSPAILTARQAVVKAKAGLGAAKDAYIPDVTGLARYSYQSGVPLLVHNFGVFGFNLSYDLFDGGRRNAGIKDARTLLTEAEVNLDKATDEVDVEVESAFDKVEESQSMVQVIEEAVELRAEAARLADRMFEQNASLASARAEAHAKLAAAKSSLLEANLGLSLAQADVKRTIGQLPR